jgi:hypothetical protein
MTGPIRAELSLREYDSYVESPTRANKTAVEVFIGNANDIGSQDPTIQIMNAGQTVSALKCVYVISPNTIQYAENDVDFSKATVLGMTIIAAQLNESTQVKTYGLLRDSSFVWTVNTQLYLDTNGYLTDIAPVSGFRTLVATSQGAGSIFINIQEPIIL